MQFGLLGPLVLADASGRPVKVAGPRLRVLLTALLLHANTPATPTIPLSFLRASATLVVPSATMSKPTRSGVRRWSCTGD